MNLLKETIETLCNLDAISKLLLAVTALLVASIPFAIYGIILEEREWQEFRLDQNCKIVGKKKGSTSTGIGYGMTSGGNMGTVITTSIESDTTGWKCDDGVTYWR